MPEEQIALENPDGFEIKTSGESVTGKRLFADGGDGHEKEANVTDPVAGASSAASASSGIPSAVKQHRVAEEGADAANFAPQEETRMADHTIPVHQDRKP